MPLSAIVDGEDVVGYQLDHPAWVALKARLKSGDSTAVLKCGAAAFGRKSRRGLHHFVHRAGSDCSAHGRETWQHLEAKRVIVEAARTAHWDAAPEVAGDGWIADVLAQSDNRRVAFEVQWSRQDDVDYEYRQGRYRESDVRAAWFTRFRAAVPPTSRVDLPVFLLDEREGSFFATVESHTAPLGDVVQALLMRRCGFRERLSAIDNVVHVDFYNETCWNCGARTAFWHATGIGQSPCGHRIVSEETVWSMNPLEAHPDVISLVRASRIRDLGSLGPRWSKRANRRYIGFGCTHCDALLGDVPLAEVRRRREPFAKRSGRLTTTMTRTHPHWCLVGSGEPCEP